MENLEEHVHTQNLCTNVCNLATTPGFLNTFNCHVDTNNYKLMAIVFLPHSGAYTRVRIVQFQWY